MWIIYLDWNDFVELVIVGDGEGGLQVTELFYLLQCRPLLFHSLIFVGKVIANSCRNNPDIRDFYVSVFRSDIKFSIRMNLVKISGF